MRLTIVGCGDAFGSGGRLQTCFHVADGGQTVLIDCGATSLLGMNRLGLAPNDVSTIFLSHLHGDHFSGLVFWLVHAQYAGKRQTPLTVVGPTGTAQRLEAAMDALFPGAWGVARKFELTFVEYDAAARIDVGGIGLETFEVSHPSGALSAALRFTIGGRILAFSGDTQWVDTLVDCAAGADLFITECYSHTTPIRFHLSWSVLEANLSRLTATRIMLSHMNPEMLAHRHLVTDPRVTLAEDGLVVDV